MDRMLKDWQTSKSPTPVTAPVETAAPTADEANSVVDDVPQLHSLKSKFEYAAKRSGVPEEILAGIASRESHVGKSLNKEGYDPEKKAFGIMQIDSRYHKLRAHASADSQAHIDDAADIVKANKTLMDKRFPNWTEEQRWRAAVAGYNMGPDNVKTIDHMDQGTTGGDYSKDVMGRARAYRLVKDKK